MFGSQVIGIALVVKFSVAFAILSYTCQAGGISIAGPPQHTYTTFKTVFAHKSLINIDARTKTAHNAHT